MTSVVQAKCPSCSRVLRIPADWLALPMKCKHCQQIFQSRRPSAIPQMTAPPNGVAAPPVAPPAVPFVPHSDALFGFHDSPDLLPPPVRRPRRGWWIGPLVGFVAFGAAAVFLGVFWPQIAELLDLKVETPGADKIASKDKDPGEEPEPPPVKDGPKDKETPLNPKKDPVPQGDLFPRRALLINVSNYLLFNRLEYGSARSNKYPGSSTAVLADQLNRPPMNLPATQITELADGGRNPFSTSKPVIEATISEFLATSREQDRVLILFTGHAIDLEKEAYLVPVEGNRDKPETLIPLTWVYEQLAKCKARQKVLIVDVFRYPPARGEELPGTGDMTDDFDAKLQNPPAGVQVWASCGKGQRSYEFEHGSLFLQALCHSLQDPRKGIAEPAASLPLEGFLPKVNQRMKEVLTSRKVEQLSRMYGREPAEGAPYDPKEPLAAKLELKRPTPPGGQAFVKNVLDEINIIPTPRGAKHMIHLASLPAFTAKSFDEYKPDYKSLKELEAMAKDKTTYPLRAAYFEVQKILKESEKIRVKENFDSPGNPVPPQVKKNILAEQQPVGIMQFELKEALAQLLKAGEKRDMEPSKRWQVNYDLAVARLKARLVYLNEYNELLAKVRGDSLPELNPGDTGFRVGSSMKVSTKESEYKKMEKEVKKSLMAIARDHPDTPWAIIAQRESMTALGLIWQPSRD